MIHYRLLFSTMNRPSTSYANNSRLCFLRRATIPPPLRKATFSTNSSSTTSWAIGGSSRLFFGATTTTTRTAGNGIWQNYLTTAKRWKSGSFGKIGKSFRKPSLLPESPPKAAVSDLKRLIALAGPEKYRLGGGVALLAISSGVTIAVPFFIGRIIDLIFKSESAGGAGAELTSEEQKRREKFAAALDRLTTFCYTLVGVFVVGAIANFGRVYLMQSAGALVVNRLRSRVFGSIIRQEIGFFDKTKTGELVNRLSNDASLVGYATTMNISDGLRSVVSGIGGSAMMWYTSPSLSIIGFAIVPPVALMAMAYGRYLRKLTKRVNDALADATQIAEERISNIRTVRAFTAETLEEKRYSNKIDSVVHLAYKDAFAKAGFFGSAGLSGNLIMLAILYKGGEYVAAGQISMGDLSSFLLYALYVGTSISGLGGFYTELMRGLGASERLFELLDRKPLIPYKGGLYLSPASFRGQLEFKDVSFAYPGRENVDVLKGVDLLVPAGSVTAIVGTSGSGKSTMAALLLRYYDATKGSVMVDGQDVRQLDANGLRSHIGTVSQEPVLFSCTIKENIAYGAGDQWSTITMDQVTEAARQANAYDFVMGLPEKFDTIVGERGVLLSGGQRQRIAIARALLKKPKILLMDEATSALDSESEHLVKQALDRLLSHSDRTVLVIAHRLSTIKNANQIAVLQDGKVVERGTYDSLLSIPDGVFKKLVERQTDSGSVSRTPPSTTEPVVRAQI